MKRTGWFITSLKRTAWLIASLVIAGFIASIPLKCNFEIVKPAYSSETAEGMMILNSPELGTHTRALVSFPHDKHADGIDCNRCHHDYDIFKANKGGDARKCSECHTAKASANNSVPLLKAFHLQCKGCHETMQKKGKTGQPMMCGQCHLGSQN